MNRLEIEKPRVVCLMSSEYGGIMVWDGDADTRCDGSYVRISEPVEITFIARDRGAIVAAQVAAVDEQINAERDKFADVIAGLQERRQTLLALTGPGDKEGRE